MNKKMREIKAEIEKKSVIANQFLEEEKIDEAENVVKEIKNLERTYIVAEQLHNNAKAEVTDDVIDKEIKNKQANGFTVIAKMIKGIKRTDVENAIVIEKEDATNPNGTNYIMPADVQTAIRELKRPYNSAKDIVNVVPVTTISGSINYEIEDTGELVEFEDGAVIDDSENPKIGQIKWTIKFFGKLIYISNIVLGNEEAQLLSYLNKWFVKKAIRTENKKIFAKLAEGKTIIPIKGLSELRTHMTTKLNPSVLGTGFIVTNQTGFGLMDSEKDAIGRGMLEIDPKNATLRMYNGLGIKVYTDAELPNVGGKAPVFVGDTKEGIDFMERMALEFAYSEHFAFNKNQNTLRVIEGFDVIQTDAEAYSYLTFEAAEVTA